MKTRVQGAKLLRSAGIAVTIAIAMFAIVATASAAGPAPVGLGTAAPFAVLAGTGITNTGVSTITGDVGSFPTATETGLGACPAANCVNLTGTNHNGDSVTQGAKTDLTAAYTVAAGLPATATHPTLGGLTLPGGVYTAGAAVLDLTGTLTLDGQGDANSVWVFQATSSLNTASSSTVALINGANPCNVFWQVTSTATLGTTTTFVGTIVALTSITMADGVTMHGRALARNGDVTLAHDTISNTCTTAIPAASASPAASAAPAATAKPSVAALPNTTTEGAPPQGGSSPWLLVLATWLVACLAVGFGLRTYRGRAQ